MKKQLFMLVMLCYVTHSMAQSNFPQGIVKVKNEKFNSRIVKSTNKGFEDYIIVSNTKNKYDKGGLAAKVYPIRLSPEDIIINEDQVRQIVAQIIHAKKEALHNNADYLGVSMIFDWSGKISDVWYAFKKDTKLSIADIAAIDAQIRSQITATYPTEIYKDYKAVPYSRFRDIIF